MKKTILILSAFVLALGLTQCKKEAPTTTNDNINNIDNGVRITLNVGNNSRANVDPNGNPNWATVSFETGDYIYVGYNNAYVGYLVCNEATANGNGTFSGTVNIESVVEGGKLHFYMLGGKDFQPDPTSISNNQLLVNISDQSTKYPVISCATSNEDYAATTTAYTSDRLMNKVSIMKFHVTTRSAAPICITGMNNKVTLNFDPATPDTDEGFTYGINTEDGGLIKMPAIDANNETWAIVLPQDDLAASETNGSANSYDDPYYYSSKRPAIHKIESNKYYHENNDVIAMTMNSRVVDLSKLTADCTAQDGDTLTGALAGNYQISIADGATTNGVTLDGVTINGTNDQAYSWAGITCLGDATIILKDETTNNVMGFNSNYPGIHIASGKTLTIQGSGSLNASSNGWGAGIGGGTQIYCGNIIIDGGDITATGGGTCAGIGSGFNCGCGTITINGGTVRANGGRGGAGIGCGFGNYEDSYCGNITITDGTVIAIGGQWAAGIGSGISYYSWQVPTNSTCGNINITGGTVNATGGEGGSIQGYCGLTTTYVHDGGAGIGTGSAIYYPNYPQYPFGYSNCGTITIGSGIISVTATKGSGAQNSIGKNHSNNQGTCGAVTIADPTKVTQN